MFKRYLLAGLLLSGAPLAMAQSAPDPLAQPGRFCVVRSIGNINDSRPGFTLDYGVPSKTNKLPDEQAYAERFRTEALRSAADMLNYMDRTGWELVQTTTVANNLVCYQYIFRRKSGQ